MAIQKSILYTPFLRISAGETYTSHVGTKCVDISGSINEVNYGTLNFLLAPFDCTVKYIDRASNSVFFESIDGNQIQTPTGVYSKMSFRCAHMNDTEWDLLKMYVGRKFYQGEPCYFEGRKINGNPTGCAKHIHIEFGQGALKCESSSLPWKALNNGNHTINTDNGGAVSIYNAAYIHKNTILEIYTGGSANNYLFTRADNSNIKISANTYALSVPDSKCKMKLAVGPYTLRNYPGGSAVATNFVFNAGTTINVLGFQPIKHTDGKFYYRASAIVNGVTKVGYMQYDPTEVYPTGKADKLFVKITQPARVRTSPDKISTTNIVSTLQAGDLQKPREFINCSANDFDNGWIKLEDGNYIQYDTNCMYIFGVCNY